MQRDELRAIQAEGHWKLPCPVKGRRIASLLRRKVLDLSLGPAPSQHSLM